MFRKFAAELEAGVISKPIARDPNRSGYDLWGNRVFESQDLAYQDRAGRAKTAALLVTPEGQELMREMPDLLNITDRALSEAVEMVVPDRENYRTWPEVGLKYYSSRHYYVVDEAESERLTTAKDIWISFVGEGSQSAVYILDIDGSMFVVKHRVEKEFDAWQPYVNLLHQIQDVESVVGSELERLRFRFPEIYFVSGSVMLCEYIFEDNFYGDVQRYYNDRSKVEEVGALLTRFVNARRRSGNPLWEHIHLDGFYDQYENQASLFNMEVKYCKGHYYMIDPFFYYDFPGQDSQE